MNIVVAGYYGFGNIGDELILSALIQQLRKKYEGAHITVLSSDPKTTEITFGVAAVDRWNPWSIMQAFWSAELFVLGGGGLLQDGTSLKSLGYYLGLLYLARIVGCSIFLYAVGVEKLKTRFGRWAIKKLLTDSSVVITVRDEESKSMLMDLGLRPEKIYVTADPVFSRGVISSTFVRYASKEWSALFIPRFPCPMDGLHIYKELIQGLKFDHKIKLKGALFQKKAEQPVFERMGFSDPNGIEELLPEMAPDKFCEEIPHYDFVVSARFHGLVMAALAGRPFIGVGDFEKVGRFCRLWKQPFLPWNASSDQIKAAIGHLIAGGQNQNPNNLEEMRAAANRTIEFV